MSRFYNIHRKLKISHLGLWYGQTILDFEEVLRGYLIGGIRGGDTIAEFRQHLTFYLFQTRSRLQLPLVEEIHLGQFLEPAGPW